MNKSLDSSLLEFKNTLTKLWQSQESGAVDSKHCQMLMSKMQTVVFLLHLINELLWWQTCNSVFQLHIPSIKEIKKSTKKKCSNPNKTSTRSSWIHMWERKRAENSPVRRPAELQRASCWAYSPFFLLLCRQQRRHLLQVRRRRAKKRDPVTDSKHIYSSRCVDIQEH